MLVQADSTADADAYAEVDALAASEATQDLTVSHANSAGSNSIKAKIGQAVAKARREGPGKPVEKEPPKLSTEPKKEEEKKKEEQKKQPPQPKKQDDDPNKPR